MKEQHKKESPVLSLLGMGGGGTGTALGGLTLPKKYVDDVFGTHLYEGNGGTQSINNGIDLAGEGGLVWTKARDAVDHHSLTDTERGYTKRLRSNVNNGENTYTNSVTAFNSNGFSLGNSGQVNGNGVDFVSWSFRKARGFFDVVTYTGNQTTRTIAHNLGSVPGMVVVKKRSGSGSWEVYHRSTGNEKTLRLNSSNAQAGTTAWNDTTPTSTHFTLSSSTDVNETGSTYIAYIFAHDDSSFGTGGDESIIKCGSYTGTGAEQFIDLGFEPQFLLHKRTEGSGSWKLFDNMRGWADSAQARLFAESSEVEATSSGDLTPTSTGFREPGVPNTSTWAYMAIRRPHKPPELATEVFNPILADTPRTAAQRPEKVDMYWFGKTGGWAENIQVSDRVRGFQNTNSGGDDTHTSPWLLTNDVNPEAASGGAIAQENNASIGPLVIGVSAGSNFINYIFKRAPGFFDVVAYDGNQAQNRQVPHNLDAVPEMMLVKSRDSSYYWVIYHKDIGAAHELRLPNNNGKYAANSWSENHTVPTDSYFVVGNTNVVNDSSDKFITYLFASLPGISKVGSYTGTGNAINVPCGFTNGARFVLIKRTDTTGDWYLWDTARGIVSGNDPYILVNSQAAQVTNTDYVDPLTSGFTVTASAPAALNASGGTYIFLAIA